MPFQVITWLVAELAAEQGKQLELHRGQTVAALVLGLLGIGWTKAA
jgi:hypothetical protein